MKAKIPRITFEICQNLEDNASEEKGSRSFNKEKGR